MRNVGGVSDALRRAVAALPVARLRFFRIFVRVGSCGTMFSKVLLSMAALFVLLSMASPFSAAAVPLSVELNLLADLSRLIVTVAK